MPNFVTHPLINGPNVLVSFQGKYSATAPHYFEVRPANNPHSASEAIESIQFQDGPLSEEHIDGVHNEDLLLMVRARLQAYQKTEFSCRENAMALTKIDEALLWLSYRTNERRSRGVEGTTTK